MGKYYSDKVDIVPIRWHKEGRGWKIPVDARKPADGRYKSKESLLAQIDRKEDVPEKTLFIITTDGMENASHRYTYDKVRRMIERQKERYGWEFLFLGANIDAAAKAKSSLYFPANPPIRMIL